MSGRVTRGIGGREGFRRAATRAGERIEDILFLEELFEEPAKPLDGMVVWADGTMWNPGSGAGIYHRRGGAWVHLG